MLEEGINEAGAISAWIAAGTSYANHNLTHDPVLHLLLDVRFPAHRRPGLGGRRFSRRAVFLIGATAGRTTLNGEGLQHQDGHSHLLAATIPNCVSYDPTYSLRNRGDPASRSAPHVRPAAKQVLLHHHDERELPAPGDAGGCRGRHHPWHVPFESCAKSRRQEDRGAAARFAARSCVKCGPPRRNHAPILACTPMCGASPASTSCAATVSKRSEHWNLLHPLEKKPQRSCRISRNAGRWRGGPVIAPPTT
jgi:hypothetical protein